MRKMICIFLTVVLVLCTPCLGAIAEADEVIGVWYLNSIESGGVSLNAASIGLEMILTLNDDGTAVVSMTDEEDSAGNWAWEGDKIIVDIDDEPMEFALVDGALLASDEEDDTKMIFGREPEAAQDFEPAPAMNNPELADFDGAWIATMIDAMGVQLPISATGMEMTLTIEGGRVSIAQAGEDDDQTLTGAQGILEGGLLMVTSGSDAEGDEDSFALTLHEDGIMSMSYAEDDMGTIYFERQIAE